MRPSKDQWTQARQTWEADSSQSFESIAKTLGCSRVAVSKRADREGWERVQNLRQIVEKAQRKADTKRAAKVAPKVTGDASVTTEVSAETSKAETVAQAIDVRAEVIEKHRNDWDDHRELFPLTEIKANFEVGKQAKISAEMLMIRQKGERAAYGLDVADVPDTGFEKLLAEIHEAAHP